MKRFAFAMLFAALAGGAATAAAPRVTTQLAQPRTGQPGYVLFAMVEPVHTVVVRAGTTGTLEDFRVRAGDRVRAGERLGRLGGPTYAASLASAQAALGTAQEANALARDSLGATEARYPLLADRVALDQAKLAAARAASDLARRKAALSALTANGAITAPVAGTVAAVPNGSGNRVAPGDAILTIHPAGALWLRGAIYGETVQAVHVGAPGLFRPTGGGHAIAVRVAGLIPGGANGGLGVALMAAGPAPGWFDGESGLVTLTATTAGEPAVPTAALVLDHGRWWVMKQANGRFEPVRVTPGGARGGWTWIAAGLRAGDRVAVAGAYLLFHRAFSEHYAGAD